MPDKPNTPGKTDPIKDFAADRRKQREAIEKADAERRKAEKERQEARRNRKK